MVMDTERWHRIERLFEQTADLPPDAQDAVLAERCADDPGLRDEVARLLAHDRAGGTPLVEVLAQLSALPVADPAPPDGYQLGPYRLVREVGQGGMGRVFEAIRADDQFHKRVAIKVASNAAWTPDGVRRFRAERQILARLEHPYIARLLDGGTTGDGVPFFAMDYVEGVPIHEYVREHRLPVHERLRLFLQVCEAVDYAHQNLVVHCDLKPGNILVSAGTVRLLDFGIARLVEGTDGTRTTSGFAPVTPDYCSPEQVRGEPVTTRTDVHGLGLVLFELLTGERAQNADTSSPRALEYSVCDVPLVAPSACVRRHDRGLARQLAGDLDTIVLTAAHRDPARRYASVTALADDIRRHLDARPIRARQDSLWYRTHRLLRRRWLPIGAAAAVAVSLSAGAVIATAQARRAERRFEQVRSLANALMFDVHEAIRDLPASTAAQDVVVRTALQYLDGLAPEAQGDVALRLDLARGYLKVAELAYSLSRPSLGRPAEARAAFDKAGLMLAALEADRPDDPAVAELSLTYRTQLAGFLFDVDTPDRAMAVSMEAVRHGEAALRAHPAHLPLLVAVREALTEFISNMGAHPATAPLFDRTVAVAEAVHRQTPDDIDALTGLAVAYSQAANHESVKGDLARASDLYRRAIDLQTRIVAREPDNATARRNLMIAWSNVADVAMGPLGANSYTGAGGPPVTLDAARRGEARAAFDRALEQARWLYDRDPTNSTARFDYAVCLGRSAPSLPPGDARAVTALEESLAIIDDLARENPPRLLAFLIEFRGSLAERLRQLQRVDRAVEQWQRVDALLRDALARDPDAYYPRRLVIPVFENWAQALADAGGTAQARRLAARVATLADEVGARESQYARAPGWPPRAREWLATFYERIGEDQAAARARQEARRLWAAVAGRTDLPKDLTDEARAALGR